MTWPRPRASDVGVVLAPLRCQSEHLWANVDTDHRTGLSHPLGKFGNVEAGAASDVEDPLARLCAERFVDEPAPTLKRDTVG